MNTTNCESLPEIGKQIIKSVASARFKASTAASNSATQPWIGAGVNDSSFTASVFASSEIYIPNYTSANNKSFSANSVNENNGTTTNMALNSNLWSNTSAITRITLDPFGGDFAQYSTATLYGIKSS